MTVDPDREAAVVRRWMMTPAVVPEGRCSGGGCWYTLPLCDGLVVGHSAPGTLEVCWGGGKPPLPEPARDRPHPDGVQPPLPVLVAACEGVSEPDGVPCGGELQYRWGQTEAACSTCGGRCGIAVAAWTRVIQPPP